MRRRADKLIPIEVAILQTALKLLRRGTSEFHGFGIATVLQNETGARALRGHGTIYKALGRLERFRMLRSRWEGEAAASAENRPARRLYTITSLGQRAVAEAAVGETQKTRGGVSRPAPAWR